MNRFFSLLRVCILGGVVVVVASAPYAFALQRQVVVSLFQARPHLESVFVRGPVDIIGADRRLTDSAGVYLNAIGNTVYVHSSRERKSPIFSGESIVLQSTSGLTLIDASRGPNLLYKGTITARARQGYLRLTNKLDARDYVKTVVGSETNADFPLEELKAQSVIAQTLLARYKPGDYLPDSTEKEAYLGWGHVTSAVEKAVDETWGQTLTFNNKPATLYFHSTCAGGTSDGAKYFELKNASLPYLRGRQCTYCKASPFWKEHTAVIPQAIWHEHFGPNPATVESRDERQRPLSVRLSGRKIGGYRLWMGIGQKLGWDKVPGTRYSIENKPDSVVLRSTGGGHGVGLCQWGACGQAQLGKTYREILAFYFPGTSLKKRFPNAAP